MRTTHCIDTPIVIVIGCDDIGSAIAHALHRAGMAVVLTDDVDPPHARRGRSYTDAWYVGGATLEAIDACFCASVRSIPAVLARGDMIAATTWSWAGLAAALRTAALIDTRPSCRRSIASARPALLEGVVTIGVRTTMAGGWPADIVIAGSHGSDRRESERAARSGGDGRSGVVAAVRTDAPCAGRFRTRLEIAERVGAGDAIGEIGTCVITAPAAGLLAALAARGARVAAGQSLAEIDASGDPRHCFGMTAGVCALAHRVAAAARSAAGIARSSAAGPGAGARSIALRRPPAPAAAVSATDDPATNPDNLDGFRPAAPALLDACPSITCRRS